MTHAKSKRRGHVEDSIYWDASRKRYIGAVDLGFSPAGRCDGGVTARRYSPRRPGSIVWPGPGAPPCRTQSSAEAWYAATTAWAPGTGRASSRRALATRRAACRVPGGLDSRPAPRSASASTTADAEMNGDRTSRAESSVMLDLVVSVQHACLVDELQCPPAVSRRPGAQSAAGRTGDHVRTERSRGGR